MKSGFSKTFQFLKKTENEAAVELLVSGLDSNVEVVRQESLRALLEHRSPAGHRAVFSRLSKLNESCRDIINERPERMIRAVSEALKTSDKSTSVNALKAILAFRLYDVLPALTEVLKEPHSPVFPLVTRTILELTETFYSELSGADRPEKHRDYDTLRKRMTTALEVGLGQYGTHGSKEVLEAFLILAKPQNVVLRRILQQPGETVSGPLIETMKTSERGGILRLLLGFLDDPQMPNAAREVLSSREDVKYLETMAKHVGTRPTKAIIETLATTKSFVWAKKDHPAFGQVDGATQAGMVTVVMHSAIQRAAALDTIGTLLLHGKPEGRRAAARAISHFRNRQATELILAGLADKDPEVLAVLLPELRPRKVPDAFSLLIQEVDSPHDEVRAALGRAMPEFTFRQFIANFDSLPENLVATSGHLVRKIDLKAKVELALEIGCLSPVRRRRAVEAAGVMGIVRDVEQAVIARLSDDDHMVRIAAAKALADCESMPSWEALRDALLDKSVIVQEAAEASLMQISQTLSRAVEDEEETEQANDKQEVAS